MIEPVNLYEEINCLISDPACTERLEVIACSLEYSFNQILCNAGKYRSCNRRSNYISGQASRLTLLVEHLYLELRFLKSAALARALVLLLGLIHRLSDQLPGTCPKVKLPKVLADKGYYKCRYYYRHLPERLKALGISDELAGLALAPAAVLLKRERIAYKMFCYIRLHLQELNRLSLNMTGLTGAEDILCEKLLCINYNNPQFTDFCIFRLKDSLKALQGRYEKRSFLKARRKKLRALEADTSLCYDANCVSAKNGLLRWIGEELRVLGREGGT